MPADDREIVKIQSILYEAEESTFTKFFSCLKTCGAYGAQRLILHMGDGSKASLLSAEDVARWSKELAEVDIEFHYTFFNANLGVSKGHNALFREIPVGDKLLIINPDVVFPPHLIQRLTAFANKQADFGIVEARQIPLEHPKDFDPESLTTSWAVTACCLFNVEAFRAVEGFDETFFMYCDDVDISWRIRARGYEVYYCTDTFIYHKKRLLGTGIEVAWAEEYYGLINSLLLRHKYGRVDLNGPVLAWLRHQKTPLHRNALREYQRLRKIVPLATAQERNASLFAKDGNFAQHRWYYEDIEREGVQ